MWTRDIADDSVESLKVVWKDFEDFENANNHNKTFGKI